MEDKLEFNGPMRQYFSSFLIVSQRMWGVCNTFLPPLPQTSVLFLVPFSPSPPRFPRHSHPTPNFRTLLRGRFKKFSASPYSETFTGDLNYSIKRPFYKGTIALFREFYLISIGRHTFYSYPTEFTIYLSG